MESFHEKVLSEAFPDGLADSDAFLMFGLLHNCRFQFRAELAQEGPLGEQEAAKAIGATWRGRGDKRQEHLHWTWRWRTEWGGQARFARLSPPEQSRLEQLKELLQRHPDVEAILA